MAVGASSSGALNARSLPSRRQVFAAFAEELLAAPFTDQTFHFVIPALADAQAAFPYEPFLSALLSREGGSSGTGGGAPWLFYFVLTVGENHLGTKRTPRLHRSRAVRPGTAAQGWVSCCQRSLWLGAPWEGAFVGGCVLRSVPGDVRAGSEPPISILVMSPHRPKRILASNRRTLSVGPLSPVMPNP